MGSFKWMVFIFGTVVTIGLICGGVKCLAQLVCPGQICAPQKTCAYQSCNSNNPCGWEIQQIANSPQGNQCSSKNASSTDTCYQQDPSNNNCANMVMCVSNETGLTWGCAAGNITYGVPAYVCSN